MKEKTPINWYWWSGALAGALSSVCYGMNPLGAPNTPTAILGALDPLTAVLVGVAVFGEPFTAALAIGIALILGGVFLVVLPRRPEGKIETGGRQ